MESYLAGVLGARGGGRVAGEGRGGRGMVGGVSSRARARVLSLGARRQLKSGAPGRRGGQSGICGTRTG